MARVFIFNHYRWYQKYQERKVNGDLHRTFQELKEECIWFHDPDNVWYQQDYWPQKIKKEIDIYGSPELVIGGSMGGWAALYFQHIINAKTVIAFNPQATTNPDTLTKWGGNVNLYCADSLRKFNGLSLEMPLSDGKSIVYYGRDIKKGHPYGDAGHKKLLIEKKYNIVELNCKDHETGMYLKNTNQLIPLIKSHLS